MAKNTKAQEVATGTPDSYTAEEAADPLLELRNRPVLGEVDKTPEEEMDPEENRGNKPSVGNNSAASSARESQEDNRGSRDLQPVAPDAENRSEAQGVESSTVHMTDGSSQETVAQPSDKPARKATPAKKATPGANRGSRPVRSVRAGSDDDF